MSNPAPARSVAVIGAGGVGGLLAGLLGRAGVDVRMLARGAALDAIRTRGLHLHGLDGDHEVPLARVADDPAALGVVDCVLVTVKTWQLAELGPRLAPLVGPRTLVVPMQNGVEASEILGRALGDDHVVGGVAHMISWAERPGEIRWMGMRPALKIGTRRPSQAADLEACAETLRTGGIDIEVCADIERVRWAKFLFISPYAAVGAVLRTPLATLRRDPAARAQLEASMREVAALATARGVALPADVVDDALRRIDALPGDARASMHRDLVDGRPSELHELIGAVVRLGREMHVPTPVSAELYAQLAPLEAKARGK
jgi:2-dehydropantoate 2-reductase